MRKYVGHRILVLATLLGAAIVLLLPGGPLLARPEVWKQTGWAKTDFSRASVPFDEILSGGPPKDGIPSIDDPKFAPIAEIKDLGPKEPVISLSLNGEARAYPLRILIWHEIVNDNFAGTPVSVTYCPLCNSAVVFDRRVDGKVLDFGTTGKLHKSNLVMYDRQSESWWMQFTGEAVVGAMLGKVLKSIPARLEAFDLFTERHPGGKVLLPPSPARRPYANNPYVGYDSRGRPYPFFTGELPEGINPMERVIVVKTADGEPMGVSMAFLRQKKTYRLGDVMLSWQAGQNSALDTRRIDQGRDVGNVVARREGASGAVDVVYDVTFAFVYHAFYPGKTIVK